MAKKKKRKGRRGKRRSAKRYASKPSFPAGAGVGAAGSGMAIFGSADNSTGYSPRHWLAAKDYAKMLEAFASGMTKLPNYKQAGLGIVVSASPRLPVIKIVAKPVDSAIKRMTKGKVGL